MKAVILAAGKGTRMLPLTLRTPKPLLEVAGKPLLHRIWESLPQAVSEVVLVVGYKGDILRAYFGDEFLGKKVTYVEQKEQLGTGHALFLCEKYLRGERFLFLFADDLYDKETLASCAAEDLAMLAAEVPNPSRFGVVVMDENGCVLELEEKPEIPKSNLVSTGAFTLDGRVFRYPLERNERFGEYFLTANIQKLAREYPVVVKKARTWIPIGYPEDLLRAASLLSGEKR